MAWGDGENTELPKEGVVGGKDATAESERAPVPEVVKPADPILVGPDGEVYVEGDEAKEELMMTAAKKKDASLAKISVKAALLLLLAASGWMLYTKMIAPPEPLMLPLTGIDAQIAEEGKKMIESRDEFDRAWNAASELVRKKFTSFYMPSTKTEHVAVSQAVSFFKLQVLEMSELAVPDDDEFKQEHVLKLKMLTCILNAAAKRLEGLTKLEQNTELPALIFDREEGKKTLPAGTVTLGMFFQLLQENKITYSPPPVSDEGAAVSHSKAIQLIDLMVMEEQMLAMDKEVHEQFDPMLKTINKNFQTFTQWDAAEFQSFLLPRDDIAFNVELFGKFLHSRYNDKGVENYRNELLDAFCQNFSNEGVNKAITDFKEQYKKAEDDLVKQKTLTLNAARRKGDVKLTAAFSLATFLL